MVAGCEERIDVLELTTPVLQADGCLGSIGAGHVLGQPSPKQANERVHYSCSRSDTGAGCRLPRQRWLTARG
jgi:hypothetical protein